MRYFDFSLIFYIFRIWLNELLLSQLRWSLLSDRFFVVISSTAKPLRNWRGFIFSAFTKLICSNSSLSFARSRCSHKWRFFDSFSKHLQKVFFIFNFLFMLTRSILRDQYALSTQEQMAQLPPFSLPLGHHTITNITSPKDWLDRVVDSRSGFVGKNFAVLVAKTLD